MYLKKPACYSRTTPGKINRKKLSRILLFGGILVTGIIFSSLTETESATIFNSMNSSPFSGGNDGLFSINSK